MTLFVFLVCFVGTIGGGLLGSGLTDLWVQHDDNKFRQAVGLETKPLRIRRIQ